MLTSSILSETFFTPEKSHQIPISHQWEIETKKNGKKFLFKEIPFFKQMQLLVSKPQVFPKETSSQHEEEVLKKQHQALKELTKEWIEEGDEKEQTETWEYLRQSLDEDRLSHRSLFS